MSRAVWDGNVELMIECKDHYRTVHNAREAIECLSVCWPQQKGPTFAAAKKACMAAATGRQPPANARATFVAAAREVGILRKH